MSVKFSTADSTTAKLVQQVIKGPAKGINPHKGLDDAKLNIQVGFAADEDEEPALKSGGYPDFARVKFFTEEDRKHGKADLRITFDEHVWDNATEDEKEAMIDSAISRFEVRTNSKTGDIIRDGANRPKLKNRKFDLRFTGFADVMKRHGRHSQEWKRGAAFAEGFKQLELFEKDKNAIG